MLLRKTFQSRKHVVMLLPALLAAALTTSVHAFSSTSFGSIRLLQPCRHYHVNVQRETKKKHYTYNTYNTCTHEHAKELIVESSTDGFVPTRLDHILSTLTLAFPAFVVAAAVTGLLSPGTLQWVNNGNIISLMLTSVMCGTGLTLRKKDFANVYENRSIVLLGVLCQYIIMPATAALVGRTILLSSSSVSIQEVAQRNALYVGLCLVGCSPGGTASNLVSLIAQANVALSVVLTACSTLLAVIVTPLLVKYLIGFGGITLSGTHLMAATARVVLFPVLAGMVLNAKAPRFAQQLSRWTPFCSVILVSLICGGVVAQNATVLTASTALLTPLLVAVLLLHSIGFAAGYIVPKLFTKIRRVRRRRGNQTSSQLSVINQDTKQSKNAVFTNENMDFGSIDHDVDDDESTCRTISIEVGMQNSALAVVLARSAASSLLTASSPSTILTLITLPGALSATAHSCLGSLLAAYWRSRPKNQTPVKNKRFPDIPSTTAPRVTYTENEGYSEFSI